MPLLWLLFKRTHTYNIHFLRKKSRDWSDSSCCGRDFSRRIVQFDRLFSEESLRSLLTLEVNSENVCLSRSPSCFYLCKRMIYMMGISFPIAIAYFMLLSFQYFVRRTCLFTLHLPSMLKFYIPRVWFTSNSVDISNIESRTFLSRMECLSFLIYFIPLKVETPRKRNCYYQKLITSSEWIGSLSTLWDLCDGKAWEDQRRITWKKKRRTV